MSKRRGRKGRDNISITSPLSLFFGLPFTSTFLREVEDRRSFYPGSSRPVFSPPSHLPIFKAARSKRPSSFPSDALAFSVPDMTPTCIRRRQRREVMFASGNGGRRGKQRRHRRSRFSDVHC